MAAGVFLTAIALFVSVYVRTVGILLFLAAVAVSIAGFVGLVLHARAEKRRRAEEPPPPNINIYRQSPCDIDESLVEKLANANANLYQRILDFSADLIPDTFKPHSDRGEALFQAKDFPEAFRENCRAMHELAKSYNRTRNKPEMFQPVWDKQK